MYRDKLGKLNTLPHHKIENYSGFKLPACNKIKTIKKHQYFIVEGMVITGDAPKAFMRVYEYKEKQHIRKSNIKSWPLYIVKTGHKWYMSESVTEYLLNQLGIDFGLEMAESKIAFVSGQLRFFSKFFLNKENFELVHGADIFAGYLGDKDFVERIEEQQLSRELFTLQFIEKALEYIFPYQKDDIMSELTKMLLFDALVGNNDRHFYNWGVIRSLDNSSSPKFSPVYDTARGLFWNDSEQKIRSVWSDKERLDAYIRRYSNQSKPKIGWDGEKNINHFKLVEKICSEQYYISKAQQKELFSDALMNRMLYTIKKKFKNYYSVERTGVITKCLIFRFNHIKRIIEQC